MSAHPHLADTKVEQGVFLERPLGSDRRLDTITSLYDTVNQSRRATVERLTARGGPRSLVI